jgi:hypothetical protein
MRCIAGIIILFIFSTCKQETKYPYALADFPDKLQPYLSRIVNTGFIGVPNYDCVDYLDSFATDKQILRLTRCEHPILRSVALSIASWRPSIDHYSLLMNHLDDTARISWHFQCASFEYKYVSDYMVMRYKWKTQAAKDSTIYKILQQHPYLECAYSALGKIKLTEAEYPIVRAMANSDVRQYIRCNAYYHLASFQKPENKMMLHDLMDTETYDLSCEALSLMGDYPDTIYLPILKKYYRHFYRNIAGESWFSNDPDCYLKALAGYRREESAEILRKIFYRKPILPYYHSAYDTSSFKETLYEIIVTNDCKAYKDMVTIARTYLTERDKKRMEFSIDPIEVDTSLYDKNRLIDW